MENDNTSDRCAEPSPGQPATGAGAGEASSPRRELPPAAQRALAEAEARRRGEDGSADGSSGVTAKEKELGGQTGPEPTRYGDWEKGGIVSDF